MAAPARIVAESIDPNELMDMHRARIARAQASLALRQRRIVRRALRDLNRRLRRARAGTWTEAEANATRVLLGQAMRNMTGVLEMDLDAGLREVTKMSAKSAARFLSTLDRKYLGAVRPLRFDTLEWWERTHEGIGQVRLRTYRRSYQRYGAEAVAKIEDAIASRILVGESWDKAREEVWDATREVVGNRQWMVDRIVRTETAAAYNGMTVAALIEENTADEPMLKKLVATFDSVTGMDSHFVHGQTRPLDKPFMDDKAREYMAPPNRPHDREIVVGWRKSWGGEGSANMRDFDEATATPRDDTPDAPKWAKPKTVTPPAPTPEDLPAIAPAASIPGMQLRLDQLRANKAAIGFELQAAMQSRIQLPRGIAHPPDTVAMTETHNLAMDARVNVLRQQIRELQEEQARLQIAIRRRRQAEAKAKAAGAEPPVERLPKPRPIAKVDGPGKPDRPKPAPQVSEIDSAEVKAGQLVEFNGVPIKIHEVRTLRGVPRLTVKVRGKDVELPIPPGVKLRTWDRKPGMAKAADALAEARELSRWAVVGEQWIRQAIRNKGLFGQYGTQVVQGLSEFNAAARKAMTDLLASLDPKKIPTFQMGAGPVKKPRLAGRGSESARLKRYVEQKDLAKSVRMSGMDEGMATEVVAEFEALRDGLALRPKTLDKLWVARQTRGKFRNSNAWVEMTMSGKTGRMLNMEMAVNAANMGTRAKARAQWLDARADVNAGRSPWSSAGYWDDEAAKLYATVRHEYGHVVDFYLRDRVAALEDDALFARGIRDLFTKRVREAGEEAVTAMTRYSATAEKEAWAEAFALAVSGKWDRVPVELHQPLRLILLAN